MDIEDRNIREALEPIVPKQTKTPSRNDPGSGFPCEIQIRTSLQQSWAEKCHDLIYKREAKADQAFLDILMILSNQLYQADLLNDIVRQKIEDMLMPDLGQNLLLSLLFPKLTLDGRSVVESAIAVAETVHADHLSLDGTPRLCHALQCCLRLVQGFGVLDPAMLVLAILHDFWYGEKLEHEDGKGNRDNERVEMEDIDPFKERESFESEMASKYGEILRQFGSRMHILSEGVKLDKWFWIEIGSFRHFRRHADEHGVSQIPRLEAVRKRIESVYAKDPDRLDDSMERAFFFEAALLAQRLLELPDEPNRHLREEGFRQAYREYDLVCDSIPSSPRKASVVEELEQVCLVVAQRLGMEIPINWKA